MNKEEVDIKILSLSKDDVRAAIEVLREFGITPTVALIHAFTLGRVQGLSEAMCESDVSPSTVEN
ncbi:MULTISPECIES: hypothetical protein [unclassified Pseudomonas]|uniref:hypothetical protein n=1 Tax=unclassified Pseudomonas TaxID=196821 RepID=UPI0011BFA963|nr:MULTISPECIES: hypothetical protein [unclassified Pseudomonas]